MCYAVLLFQILITSRISITLAEALGNKTSHCMSEPAHHGNMSFPVPSVIKHANCYQRHRHLKSAEADRDLIVGGHTRPTLLRMRTYGHFV